MAIDADYHRTKLGKIIVKDASEQRNLRSPAHRGKRAGGRKEKAARHKEQQF